MKKRKLRKAYAKIEKLLEKCEEEQKENEVREVVILACLLEHLLDAEGFVHELEKHRKIEDRLSSRSKACYRALYLISEQIGDDE